MEDLILSVDLGTTAVKVALFGQDGQLKAVSTREYDLETPSPNIVECTPQTYWNAFKEGIKDLQGEYDHDPESIQALGLSAQGETLFFLDEHGRPLRDAIVWMDNRAQDESKLLSEEFGNKECYQRTGHVSFDPAWPASKILWCKNHEAEVFNNTDKFLLIEDYFIYRLTGHFVSEGSLLTSTVYWNINTKDWWTEMLEYLEIDETDLPEIMESGQFVDTIQPGVAEELSLSSNTGVCTGALDQAAGAIGVGNVSQGSFSENIGAALAVCAPVNEYMLDDNRVMPLHYFSMPDTYMFHSFTTGGMVFRWFRDKFGKPEIDVADLLDEDPYDILSKEAQQVPPGNEGLIMLPHLTGSMAPNVNPSAKGVYYGFTLKHGKKHFTRAIMESIGYLIRRNIEAISDIGLEVDKIRSLGGGARSEIWNQIKADITGKPLFTLKCKEAASLGAAILAGKAIGLYNDTRKAVEEMVTIDKKYEPHEDNKAIYDKYYEGYKKLFQDLSEMFDKY